MVVRAERHLLYPLDVFYTLAGLPMPQAERIDPADMPETHRALLHHDHDMTPTLEKHFNVTLELNVLHRRHRGTELMRHVLLVPEGGGPPAECGAIVIDLPLFEPEVRTELLECRVPMGTLLHKYNIEHQCNVGGLLRVQSDSMIRKTLNMTVDSPVYGRKNVLTNPEGETLAEVVELLPPDL